MNLFSMAEPSLGYEGVMGLDLFSMGTGGISKSDNTTYLKALTIRNFIDITGQVTFELTKGLNFIVREDVKYDYFEHAQDAMVAAAGYVPEIADAERLYYRTVPHALRKMKSGEQFNELEEFSFYFEGEKAIELGFTFSSAPLGVEVENVITKKKKYRKRERTVVLSNGGKCNSRLMQPLIDGVRVCDSNELRRTLNQCKRDLLISELDKLLKEFAPNVYLCVTDNDLYFVDMRLERSISVDEPLIALMIFLASERELGSNTLIIMPDIRLVDADEDLEKCMSMLRNFERQTVVFFHDPIGVTDLYCDMSVEGLKRQGINAMSFDREIHGELLPVREAARRLIRYQELTLRDKLGVVEKHFDNIFSTLGQDLVTSDNQTKRINKIALGMSFGIDSMITFHLMDRYLQKKPDIEKPILVFCDTKIEFQEHYAFGRRMIEVFEEKGYELIWEKTETNFFKFIEEEGFPIFAKTIREKSNPELYHRIKELEIRYCGNECCKKMKKDVYNKVYNEIGADLIITGIVASESNERRQLYYRNYNFNQERGLENAGDVVYVATEDRFKAYPCIHLSKDDVRAIHVMYGHEYSPVYDLGYEKVTNDGDTIFKTYERTGCKYCGMGLGYEDNNLAMLRRTHPADWRLIMVHKGLGKELYRFKEYVKPSEWNDQHQKRLEFLLNVEPSYFDVVSI